MKGASQSPGPIFVQCLVVGMRDPPVLMAAGRTHFSTTSTHRLASISSYLRIFRPLLSPPPFYSTSVASRRTKSTLFRIYLEGCPKKKNLAILGRRIFLLGILGYLLLHKSNVWLKPYGIMYINAHTRFVVKNALINQKN